jgi:cell wall-associated NlpC family hydrolase
VPHQWYFENAAAVQRLRSAAAEWEGTPFRPFSRAKGEGGGIDCVGFCEEVFVAAGVVQPFSFPRTDADYQSHRTALRILDYLRGKVTDDPQSAQIGAIFAEIRLPQLADGGDATNLYPGLFMPGDLLVLRDEGQIHLPIVLRGRRFVHCMRPDGVSEGTIHDTTFSAHFVAMFRARATPLEAVPVRAKRRKRAR